jgi:transcription initiation factor TFIIIB Brf1 subunit/transcription initiation factor TFIIB
MATYYPRRKIAADRRAGAALKAIDREIERIYTRLAAGRSIDVMKIGELFDAGRTAAIEGRDLEGAIAEAIGRLTT